MTHRNSEEISSFEVLDVLLRAEGFSCSLDVFHGVLGIKNCICLFIKLDFL
jgi:hypothetical protein